MQVLRQHKRQMQRVLIVVIYHLSGANWIKVPCLRSSSLGSALENEPEGDKHRSVQAVEDDREGPLCRLACIISFFELVAHEVLVFIQGAIHFLLNVSIVFLFIILLLL